MSTRPLLAVLTTWLDRLRRPSYASILAAAASAAAAGAALRLALLLIRMHLRTRRTPIAGESTIPHVVGDIQDFWPELVKAQMPVTFLSLLLILATC
ncbi:hypothetical protein DFJ73DRAFT_776217 [Zopfochytrium polystomum]|nr:hypothetical protein DFJ73DRAFT_776217 [Zopfochytrium polystomum]